MHTQPNDKIYNGTAERLRKPERIRLLEVERVVDVCMAGNAVKSVLDIGTGSGLFAEAFAKRRCAVTGIDINYEMVTSAKQHVPDALFHTGVMESLPFRNQSFDLVFMGLVLHETEHLAQAMMEAHRVSKSWTAILEWPYKQEERGPTLDHRLRPEQIHQNAGTVGYFSITRHPLSHLELWILKSN